MDERAVCSCLPGMFGAPPNCRPECVIHQDCPSNRACIKNRCEDPCIGSCGFNAICTATNHRPVCLCIEGYEGDPYAGCTMRQSKYILNFPMDDVYIKTIFTLLYYIFNIIYINLVFYSYCMKKISSYSPFYFILYKLQCI